MDGLLFLAGLAVTGIAAALLMVWVVPLVIVIAVASADADAGGGHSGGPRAG